MVELVGIFLLPDDPIKNSQINPHFVNGKFPEIPPLACDVMQRVEEIMDVISR